VYEQPLLYFPGKVPKTGLYDHRDNQTPGQGVLPGGLSKATEVDMPLDVIYPDQGLVQRNKPLPLRRKTPTKESQPSGPNRDCETIHIRGLNPGARKSLFNDRNDPCRDVHEKRVRYNAAKALVSFNCDEITDETISLPFRMIRRRGFRRRKFSIPKTA